MKSEEKRIRAHGAYLIVREYVRMRFDEAIRESEPFYGSQAPHGVYPCDVSSTRVAVTSSRL